MPLRVIGQNACSVNAANATDSEWEATKSSLKADRTQWRLPCCDSPPVAKTSKRGTRFFAHLARGACNWAPETEHHLAIKAMCLHSASKFGWEASTECSGVTPDGESWKADVLATLGDYKIAIEVQWSHQTNQELLERQRRYASSGVRCLWLIRGDGYPVTEELPAISVRPTDDSSYRASIPAWDHARLRDTTDWAYYDLPLADALDAAFDRRLSYGFKLNELLRFDAIAARARCWTCKTPTVLLAGFRFSGDAYQVETTLDHFAEHVDLLHQLLPPQTRALLGIGDLLRKTGRVSSEVELVNSCSSCGAIYGTSFLHRLTYFKPIHSTDLIASFEVRAFLNANHYAHWRILGMAPDP
jgi:hypothetical protein